MEHALLDIMYELPSMENVEKVVIDENMITGTTPPLLIYAEQPKVSGGNWEVRGPAGCSLLKPGSLPPIGGPFTIV